MKPIILSDPDDEIDPIEEPSKELLHQVKDIMIQWEIGDFKLPVIIDYKAAKTPLL